MKKKIFIVLLLSLLILSGCAKSNTGSNSGNMNVDQNNELEQEPDMATICSGLCGRTIQDLCQDEIADYKASGQSMDGAIIDEASCQLMCEAEWTVDTIECVSAADTCAQFLNSSPYCIETEVDDEEVSNQPALPGNCDKACKNYAKCAGYGDGVTAADQQAAYESCLTICSSWDDKTRDCVSNTAIGQAADCVYQTACVLPDVNSLLNQY